MKKLKIVLFSLLSLCLIAGILIIQNHKAQLDIETVSAHPYSYNYADKTLMLQDSNGELWVFCGVPEPAKDTDYRITYCGDDYNLLSLTANGQEIPFV